MSLTVPAPDPQVETQDIVVLDGLRELSRQHLLYFRLRVGHLLLHSFFGGDVSEYSRRDGPRDQRFRAFLQRNELDLKEIGLQEATLRQCIAAQTVVSGLPDDVVQRLVFTHFVELSRVKDEAQRLELARTAIENGWRTRDLRRAITGDKLNEGSAPHSPAATAETDLPAARNNAPGGAESVNGRGDNQDKAEGGPSLQPGRLVTRLEKLTRELELVRDAGLSLRARPWPPDQRRRVTKSLSRLERLVPALQSLLLNSSG
jgi:hypothetical protein